MLIITDAEIKLTALEKKMLSALTLPMGRDCPSGLRYELAKYDADDVTEAYTRLYGLYKNGKIADERNAK